MGPIDGQRNGDNDNVVHGGNGERDKTKVSRDIKTATGDDFVIAVGFEVY